MHWGINSPPSKIPPPLSCQVSLLNLQICKLPFLSNTPYILAFRQPPPLPLKLGFFSEPPKVTKFSLKISQFEFLVMTRQSALVYKLVLSLNIRDFSLFFVKKLRPPTPEKKVTPSFPATPL